MGWEDTILSEEAQTEIIQGVYRALRLRGGQEDISTINAFDMARLLMKIQAKRSYKAGQNGNAILIRESATSGLFPGNRWTNAAGH